MQKKTPRKTRLPLLLALSLAGCSEVLGLGDDYKDPVGSTCLPGSTKKCSPEASGACLDGFQVCKQDGTGHDVCLATTAPAGAGCACAPGATVPCYDGLPETLGVGACAAGKKTCGESGAAFGACEGQVLCAGQFRWAKMYGDAIGQLSTGVAADGQGNVIVVGRVSGTVDFGGVVTQPAPKSNGTDHDIFVLKLDPEGKLVWVKRMGDESPQVANDVAIDPTGNIVVTGYAGGTVDFGDMKPVPPVDPASLPLSLDAFVIKLDPDGNLLWQRRAGDALNQSAQAVAVDDNGNVVIAGYFGGKMSFDPMTVLTSKDMFDIFITKLKPDGNHLWSKSFGDVGKDFGYGVATDAHGNVIVTGEVRGTVDFGGEVTQPAPMSNGMDSDVFVLKLDAAMGTRLWARRFGDKGTQFSNAVAVDPRDESVVITGEFTSTLDLDGTTLTAAGANDAFLARLDTSGTITFRQRFGEMAASGTSVAIDSHGDMVLVGNVVGAVNFGVDPGTLLTGAGGIDMAVVKLDSTGRHLWSKLFGDGLDQFCTGVALDAQGNVLVTGYNFGAVDFGGGPLSTAGLADIAVVKLSP